MTREIWYRKKVVVNTDPQRRCYDGCHFSSREEWTAWGLLEGELPDERVVQRLKFWRELNNYAVSERGDSAGWEFEVRPS